MVADTSFVLLPPGSPGHVTRLATRSMVCYGLWPGGALGTDLLTSIGRGRWKGIY